MDFLIHWPPGPVVATVQCQGLNGDVVVYADELLFRSYISTAGVFKRGPCATLTRKFNGLT